MKLLVTGSSKSGSWKVRGEQLGEAIGATVQREATSFRDYDAIIVLKRPSLALTQRIHASHLPIIYDIIDAWPQPEGNKWGRNWCLDWLLGQLKLIRPQAIVATTHKMAEDCEFYGVPTLVLPHHARPGQPLNPIRERVCTVGYEGAERYLGKWEWSIRNLAECRGWSFLLNPVSFSHLDIAVAVRVHTGYAVRNWKSNIKLANAQATGTPCIMTREAGYLETACGAECWADDDAELQKAFDYLTDYTVRRDKSEALARAGHLVSLETIATKYKEWLCELKF